MSEPYSSRFESKPHVPSSGGRPVRPEWSRKQKRGYQRIRSLLWFWEAHHFQVLWVTLSTADGGQADKLTYHHKQLRQRIERQLGYRGLEYYQVRTEEGHGVLHIFRAGGSQMANVIGASGLPSRGFPHSGKPCMAPQWSGLRPMRRVNGPAIA